MSERGERCKEGVEGAQGRLEDSHRSYFFWEDDESEDEEEVDHLAEARVWLKLAGLPTPETRREEFRAEHGEDPVW